MDKTDLIQLYAQKGEIVTEMEIMQAQLQRVNQQIIQLKNAIMKEIADQRIKENADQETKKKHDE